MLTEREKAEIIFDDLFGKGHGKEMTVSKLNCYHTSNLPEENNMKLFEQEINNDVWNFSEFQINTANNIQEQPNFDRFVNVDFASNEIVGFVRKRGVFNMLWYDTDGHLNVYRCGVKKILFTTRSESSNSYFAAA